MASELSSMTLAPDRTCRLKFPVVAEELIEYSGARHGAAFSSNLGGKTLDFGGKTFAAAIRRRHRKMRVRVWRKGVATSRQRANFSPLSRRKNFVLLVSPSYYCSSPRLRLLKLFIKTGPPRECQSRGGPVAKIGSDDPLSFTRRGTSQRSMRLLNSSLNSSRTNCRSAPFPLFRLYDNAIINFRKLQTGGYDFQVVRRTINNVNRLW